METQNLKLKNLEKEIRDYIKNDYSTDYRIGKGFNCAFPTVIECLLDYIISECLKNTNNITNQKLFEIVHYASNGIPKVCLHHFVKYNPNSVIINNFTSIDPNKIKEYIESKNATIEEEPLKRIVYLLNKFTLDVIHYSIRLANATRQKTIDSRCLLMGVQLLCNYFENNELSQLMTTKITQKITSEIIQNNN
jgi:hypothetical protein